MCATVQSNLANCEVSSPLVSRRPREGSLWRRAGCRVRFAFDAVARGSAGCGVRRL